MSMVSSLRDQLTPREGAGRLPALLLDQGQPPGQLPVTGQGYVPPKKRRCCCWERGCIISLFRRHPLISFFVLAYALSWWPSILYALDLSPQPVAGFGPFLAALVVLALAYGKAGIGGLLRRMVRWRVGLRAVCTTVDRLRYSLYESLFDGSKGKGACRCRPRHSQKRDSPHARSLRAHRKALSQIEKGDGIGGTEASSQTPFLDRPERPTQKGLVEPARRT